MFFDEKGHHKRTKKEILNSDGSIRQGCKIISKGEIYETAYLSGKNPLFKSKKYAHEVKVLFKGRKDTDELILWTRCQRKHRSKSDTFEVSQQVAQFSIGDISEYPEKICPYIPVVWNLVTGENYGRGLVEDFA